MGKKKYTIEEATQHAKDFVSYIQNEHRIPVEQAFLFGSYAQNTQRDWSDVDVCIVSPAFARIDPLVFLFKKRREQDIAFGIEPVGFFTDAFTDADPFAQIIKSTGKRIV